MSASAFGQRLSHLKGDLSSRDKDGQISGDFYKMIRQNPNDSDLDLSEFHLSRLVLADLN